MGSGMPRTPEVGKENLSLSHLTLNQKITKMLGVCPRSRLESCLAAPG
jgi:hypothetical protein